MTTEPTEEPHRTSRRVLLLGAGLAGLGLGGALAGCSTAAVPYGAEEDGQPDAAGVEGTAPAAAPTAGAMPSGTPAGQGMGGTAAPSKPMSGTAGKAQPKTAGGKGTGAAGKDGGMAVNGTVLAAVSAIPVGGGKVFPDQKVVVTQPARGQYRAFSAICTHVGCVVNQVANGTIDCPCHGSEFKITDGAVVTGPAAGPLPAKQIKVMDGKVVLL